MKKGLVHIYTGNGKGKTTAALGLALRALGHKQKVCLIQFMKKGSYGELRSLQKLQGITIRQFGTSQLIKKGKVTDRDKKEAAAALRFAAKTISQKFDLVILDEIIVAIHFGLIEEPKVLELIKEKPKTLELVLTGRKVSAKIISTADLVTEMKEIKHYYRQGVTARKGIEY
ncbi:MAG: cob(I)yrinic acid a,c-diamide adenosyltransferase [Patescibacteria group bacterium]